jgi:DHA1 family bicyclomycin/chloramphenicol resistance-like MFS transporter
LPETLAKPTMNGAPVSMLQSYRIVLSNRVYLAYLGLGSLSYAGLFAWLSGASFVLQNLYGLTPFVFGVVFAIGAVGYMIGTTIAARVVARVGLDRVAGLGSAMLAMGGLLMSLSVAVGLTSSLSLVLPVALFLAGLGMVLPQSIAGAMTPFPERAGAASSLFGFVQQAAAAACGALVAWLLGHDAWPLAAAMALTGCATLLLWLLTRGVRRAAAKF